MVVPLVAWWVDEMVVIWAARTVKTKVVQMVDLKDNMMVEKMAGMKVVQMVL